MAVPSGENAVPKGALHGPQDYRRVQHRCCCEVPRRPRSRYDTLFLVNATGNTHGAGRQTNRGGFCSTRRHSVGGRVRPTDYAVTRALLWKRNTSPTVRTAYFFRRNER